MLERVDFYVLPEGQGREAFACRLAEKAYKLGHRVWLRLADAEQETALDALLWEFRPESFVPHARYSLQNLASHPVWLAQDHQVPPPCDLLINLSPKPYTPDTGVQRIAEVVSSAPAVLAATRQQFAHYKRDGLVIHTHKL